MSRSQKTSFDLLPRKRQNDLWAQRHPCVPADFEPEGLVPFDELSNHYKKKLWLINHPRVPASYVPPPFNFYDLPVSLQSEVWRHNSPHLPPDFDINDIPLSELTPSEYALRLRHIAARPCSDPIIDGPALSLPEKLCKPLKQYFKNNPGIELTWRRPFGVRKERQNYSMEYFPHGRAVIPEHLEGLTGPEFYSELRKHLKAIHYEDFNHSTGNSLSRYVHSED